LKCIFNRHYFGEGDTEISYTNTHKETPEMAFVS